MADQTDDSQKKNTGFQHAGSLFSQYQLDDGGGYITQEFQDYGYRLAVELNDLKHKSLYIKMAKEVSRGILERARSFVIDSNARNKARLFMWKVKQLKLEKAKKDKKPKAEKMQQMLYTTDTNEPS